MPGIFDDERRGSRSKAPDPFGTGPLCGRAASRASCVGPATGRHPLLAVAESGSRDDRCLIVTAP